MLKLSSFLNNKINKITALKTKQANKIDITKIILKPYNINNKTKTYPIQLYIKINTL